MRTSVKGSEGKSYISSSKSSVQVYSFHFISFLFFTYRDSLPRARFAKFTYSTLPLLKVTALDAGINLTVVTLDMFISVKRAIEIEPIRSSLTTNNIFNSAEAFPEHSWVRLVA